MVSSSIWKGIVAGTFGIIGVSVGIHTYNNKRKHPGKCFDVAIVGAGVVGLAIAREVAIAGHSVVVLERETDIAAGASSGNSGLGCTGYDSPVGSLERKLLRRSIQRHPAIYRSFGMTCVGLSHPNRSCSSPKNCVYIYLTTHLVWMFFIFFYFFIFLFYFW